MLHHRWGHTWISLVSSSSSLAVQLQAAPPCPDPRSLSGPQSTPSLPPLRPPLPHTPSLSPPPRPHTNTRTFLAPLPPNNPQVELVLHGRYSARLSAPRGPNEALRAALKELEDIETAVGGGAVRRQQRSEY